MTGALSTSDLFAWHAHPDVWALMIALLAGYVAAIAYLGPKKVPAGQVIVTTRQKACWVLGVAILWIGSDWPIHDIAERYLFSVHMVQHTMFSLIAAPLLLLGLPAWLLRTILAPRWLFRLTRFLTRPFVALVIFNVVIVLTHWPTLVNLALEHHAVHFLLHVVLVTASLIMWWPVVDPLPELKRLSPPGKMLYLFLQSIVPTVPASFLTFGSRPLYSFYAHVPHPWVNAITDQRIAGLIMKIGGGLLLWTVIAVIFFSWNAREESQASGTPEVPWEDFERELEVWDMRK
jgi:putative membrane protein